MNRTGVDGLLVSDFEFPEYMGGWGGGESKKIVQRVNKINANNTNSLRKKNNFMNHDKISRST